MPRGTREVDPYGETQLGGQNMLPQEQLIIGFASGLTFWALLRWTPLLRDLIAATAAAALINFVVNEQPRGPDFAALAAKLSAEILNYPHFWLGLALALAGVLAVIHFTRPQ
jgi:hypothetical protein